MFLIAAVWSFSRCIADISVTKSSTWPCFPVATALHNIFMIHEDHRFKYRHLDHGHYLFSVIESGMQLLNLCNNGYCSTIHIKCVDHVSLQATMKMSMTLESFTVITIYQCS